MCVVGVEYCVCDGCVSVDDGWFVVVLGCECFVVYEDGFDVW